jgi:hypothetical protein
MATKEQQKSTSGFIQNAFKAGMTAAEDINKRAFDIPISILEGMGAPEDKMEMIREKKESLLGDLYKMINSVAAQIGIADSDDRKD